MRERILQLLYREHHFVLGAQIESTHLLSLKVFERIISSSNFLIIIEFEVIKWHLWKLWMGVIESGHGSE